MDAATMRRTDWRLARELALRDVRGTYSRSRLGVSWIVVSPLGVLAIYWVVFAYVLGVSWTVPGTSMRLPYALPFFCGLVPYLAIADVMSSATNQFESKRTLVAKASFPLIVVPTGAWLKSTVVAAPGLVCLLLLAPFQAASLSWWSLTAVGALVCTVVLSAGLALLLSALGAFFGDLQHALQLVVRVLFYTAPISYPLSVAPDAVKTMLMLNPLTAIAEWFRAALAYGVPAPLEVVVVAVLYPLVVLAVGWFVFARVHKLIPDVI